MLRLVDDRFVMERNQRISNYNAEIRRHLQTRWTTFQRYLSALIYESMNDLLDTRLRNIVHEFEWQFKALTGEVLTFRVTRDTSTNSYSISPNEIHLFAKWIGDHVRQD